VHQIETFLVELEFLRCGANELDIVNPAVGGALPAELYQFPALVERYDVSVWYDLFREIACRIADATANFQYSHIGPHGQRCEPLCRRGLINFVKKRVSC
jgi:hypothetical protein